MTNQNSKHPQHDKLAEILIWLKAQWPIKRCITALALLMIEVLICHQFAIVLGILLYAGVNLVRAGFHRFDLRGPLLSSNRSTAPAYAATGLIYLLLAVLATAVNILNMQHYGPWAFERVVSACKAYHHDTGRYPSDLDELSPEYIAVIPPAKISLVWFFYEHRIYENKNIVGWNVYPPFFRCYYDLKSDTRFCFD